MYVYLNTYTGSDDSMNCYVVLSKLAPQEFGRRRLGDNDTASNDTAFDDDLFTTEWDGEMETMKIEVKGDVTHGSKIKLTFSKDDFALR